MPLIRSKILLVLLALMLLTANSACQEEAPITANASTALVVELTVTETRTLEPTMTSTPANTITPRPSQTPSITSTAFPTLTPTPLATPFDSQPAVLFPFQDSNGRTVDWSYIHVTQIGVNSDDEINDLWAFMAFQLLDRAVHQRNLQLLDETISVYYLNVAHDFNGRLLPMQLVLGGTVGANVTIENIPSGGTAYIQAQVRPSSEGFDPFVVHRDANREFELREESSPRMLLSELQALLATLGDEIILLADHPILIPRNEWPQVKLDMSQISYLAARYQPFFDFDEYGQLVDQSDFAYDLRDHIFEQRPMPEGLYAYSSKTLVILQKDE
jgi:hypothetical protein